jgi:hypothetical protein
VSSRSRWIVRRSGRAPRHRVEALLRQVLLRVLGQLEAHVLVLELGLDPGDEDVDDLQDLVLAQLVEDDRVVDAVEELRAEVLLQLVVDLVFIRS